MKNDHKNIDIIDPKNQLNLFGYEDYFNSFIKLSDIRLDVKQAKKILSIQFRQIH